jgi:A118 family predicted phage portal protein
MIGRESIQQVLKVTPIVSDKMREAIELWEQMYKNESPWLNENVHSLGIASLIASEKARMATIEMEIKVTGDSERAEFMKETFKQITSTIRKELEYGIALGGFIIKPYVVKGPDDKYRIKFNYVNADNFYPLSFSADGFLTSGAFVDRIVKADKVYSKFEVHTLENNTIVVTNKAFVAKTSQQNSFNQDAILGDEISLESIPEWSAIQPTTIINNVDTLLFSYFRNPEANTVDMSSPLGTSGYSRAVGLIQKADEQYSNLLWEFEGGQLAIDVDRTALNPIRTELGDKFVLPKLQDRLYRRNLDLGEDDMYNVYSPTLRDDSIINGLNNILMHIEDVCALSRGTISEVTSSEARTATELKILKQRAFSANADIQKELENVFIQVFRIMDIYCDLYSIVSKGEYEVAYHWDDSILVDKDAERQIDLIDVEKGLMSKVEYRVKWKGETEAQAEEALKKIADAALEAQKRVLELGQQFSNNETSDKQTPVKRGVESNSPKKKEEEK